MVFGHAPPIKEIIWISDLLILFLVQPWVEIASLGQPTAKPSHGVQMLAEKTWLRFTLQVIHVKWEVLYSFIHCSVERLKV